MSKRIQKTYSYWDAYGGSIYKILNSESAARFEYKSNHRNNSYTYVILTNKSTEERDGNIEAAANRRKKHYCIELLVCTKK